MQVGMHRYVYSAGFISDGSGRKVHALKHITHLRRELQSWRTGVQPLCLRPRPFLITWIGSALCSCIMAGSPLQRKHQWWLITRSEPDPRFRLHFVSSGRSEGAPVHLEGRPLDGVGLRGVRETGQVVALRWASRCGSGRGSAHDRSRKVRLLTVQGQRLVQFGV